MLRSSALNLYLAQEQNLNCRVLAPGNWEVLVSSLCSAVQKKLLRVVSMGAEQPAHGRQHTPEVTFGCSQPSNTA
jgi:hypothetical protein